MKRALVILFALAVGAHESRAGGSGGIEGTVVDQETRAIAAHLAISVTCGSVHKSTTTDGSGHFSIAGLPEGACTLIAAGGAYAASSVAVTVSAGTIATILVDVISRATVERQKRDAEIARAQMKKYKRMAPRRADFDDVRGEGGMAEPMEAPMPAAAAPPPPPMHHAAPPAKPAPVARPAATPPAVAAGPMKAPIAIKAEEKAVKLDVIAKGRRKIADKPIAIGGEQVNGWAVVRVFPVPGYTKAYEGPRDDFRETIYWNPAIETNASGDAAVTFYASDAVTTFRATTEGFAANGTAGGGQLTFQSKLPLTLDAHLPVEVTSGDTIQLPITIANETDHAIDATLDAKFGAAFKISAHPAGDKIHLAAKDKQSVFFALDVVATDGNADVSLDLAAGGLSDQLKKTIRVVPRGFPFESSASGTAHAGQVAHHTVDLAAALPGSIRATVTMYPSPVAAMTKGMEAMIREPGGCFEQTSSSNYPNVMVLAYMGANESADPKLVQDTRGKLDRGYKLLTGYETPEKGYEWFGHQPGHEALTAYGLMEFADMSKVYDVDKKMVERTADWLMTRRDSKGGFMRSAEALDSFGRAGEQTTNAYIMWALSEARRTASLSRELDTQKTVGSSTKDPYLLALAANTASLNSPKAAETAAMVKRLAGMQGKDGSFTGAKETITMSGGESLVIETTALAELAFIKASPHSEYDAQIRAAVEYLNSKRSGYGSWSNTQATILGLKALTAYSEYGRTMQVGGTATLVINGVDAGTIKFDKGRRDALVWNDIASKLVAGKNTIELRMDGPAALPYSIAIDYRSANPATSPHAKIAVKTELLKTKARMGEGITLRAHVENTTAQGVPMTLARIGLPGGTVFQTWQLKELRDKGLIDFYETRPREVILYWRALAPSAKKDVDINLLAAVPGTYEAPASSAYLYYTAEDKTWTKPVAITIEH